MHPLTSHLLKISRIRGSRNTSFKMSSSKTLQPGIHSSQAIKDVTKRRTGLLKDNSWIKRDREEDEPVDVDPNYGRDILLKTRTNNDSKPADATLTNPAATTASVNSLTKSIATPSKSSPTAATSSTTPTPNKPPVPANIATPSKSSQTAATSSTTPTPNKPPVPAKNPTLTTASRSFTARVFSGANSSEKAFSPVKRSVDEKPPVSEEPPKEVTNDDNNAPLSQVPIIKPATSFVIKSESKSSVSKSATVPSTSQTTATFTSPEKTQPHIATKTDPTKSYEQSNGNSDPKITITVTTTTPKMAMGNANASSTTVRSDVKQSASPFQSLSVKSPPPTQLPSNRIIGKRDLCSFCGKRIVEGERMILDDLQIFSHTSCFKCELCYRSLGSLEAGASLWVHKETVNCENCYKKTKEQWFH